MAVKRAGGAGVEGAEPLHTCEHVTYRLRGSRGQPRSCSVAVCAKHTE